MKEFQSVELLEWWKKHEERLPYWPAACQQVLLCQPSSTVVERVFSLLKNSFDEQQSSALEDYIDLTLILQRNKQSILFGLLCFFVLQHYQLC